MKPVSAAVLSEQLRVCVGAAAQAPSIHNTQPWRFVLRPAAIELHADLRYRLAVIDPNARALHVSCGAALLNLRLAVAAHGWHPRVLFMPDPGAPAHLATVYADRRGRVDGHDQRLAQAIWARHTSREPFSARPVPDAVRDRLCEAASREGARLRFVDEDERAALLSVVRTAEARLRRTAAYRGELAAWTAADGRRDDGVPASAFGGWSLMEILPLRDFAVGRPVVRRVARFEAEPTIAVLSGFGDDAVDWVRAGMALELVLLEATASGLATSLMTQPLDIPELRDLLAGRAPLDVPQAILRLGFGPPGAPTPRRPVQDVIET